MASARCQPSRAAEARRSPSTPKKPAAGMTTTFAVLGGGSELLERAGHAGGLSGDVEIGDAEQAEGEDADEGIGSCGEWARTVEDRSGIADGGHEAGRVVDRDVAGRHAETSRSWVEGLSGHGQRRSGTTPAL